MSCFQDDGHDVRPGRLPVSLPSACDVIGLLYVLQFLIHSTLVLVTL